MKDQISIKFLGGVEDKEKGVSLTGSSILTTVDLGTSKVKVLTDIGMFQGGQKDDEYNKLIDERALKADYVIITHAHMDHIGRIALLVKKGFKGKIITTAINKDLIPIMLEDYVTITRNNIEEQEEMKKRRGAQFKDYLKAVKLDEELKNNKDLKKADKTAKLKTLNGLKGTFSSVEEFVKYAKLELAKKDILKESDIAQAIETQEIELLYDEDDIKKTMSMIETLEFGDEMDLDNRIIISSLDDENIDKIPELIKGGYDKKIYILPVLKQPIIGKWKKKLDNNKTLTKEIKEDEEILDNLSRELVTALEFVTFQKGLKSREQKVDIKEENVISTDSLELLEAQKSELEILIDDEGKFFNTQELTTFINENISFLTKLKKKDLDEALKLEKEELTSESQNNIFSIDFKKKLRSNLYYIKDLANKDLILLKDGDDLELILESLLSGEKIIFTTKSQKKVFLDFIEKKIALLNNRKEVSNILSNINLLKIESTSFNLEESTSFQILIGNLQRNRSKCTEKDLLNNISFTNIKNNLEGILSLFTHNYLLEDKKDLFLYLTNLYKKIKLSNKNLNSFHKKSFNNANILLKNNNINSFSDIIDLSKKLSDNNLLESLLEAYFVIYLYKLELDNKINESNLVLSKYPKELISSEDDINKFISKYSNLNSNFIEKSLINITDNFEIKDILLFDDNFSKSLESLTESNIILVEENNKKSFETSLGKIVGEIEEEKNKSKIISKYRKILGFYKINPSYIDLIFNKGLPNIQSIGRKISSLNNKILLLSNSSKKENKTINLPQDNSEQIAFETYSSLLNKYNISNQKDLLGFIQAEKDKIEIKRNSFITKEDIKLFSSFLEPVFKNPNQKVIESFKLRFFEAGHIAGSVQAQVTIVTKQVEHTLNKVNYNPKFKRSFNNILYSGDLGKITQPNLSGSPVASPHKIDIGIFESTYAGREHPDKYIEFDKFVDELNSTVGKNLILTFSLDREQEVEFMLLKNKEDNRYKFPQFKAFREAIKPLKQRLRSLSKIENPTEKEINDKIDLAEAVSIMNDKITESQKGIYTGNIIVDAPLAIKIKKVYLKHMPEKYYLLDTEIQKEIFDQEITRTLQKGEYKDLYTAERIRAKDTIIAGGGMAQGGSGLNHIKELLEDPNSKIFFVGYQAEGTLGNKLISGEKQVIIDDKVYNVRCKVVQVGGFSAHPSHSDTVKYITKDLTFAKSAKIILTHGGENRKILASDIEKQISGKVQVLISDLGGEITAKL